MIYTLKTPIEVSGNKLEKIELQEPDFGMISEIGFPADAKDPLAGIQMIKKYIAKCSDLPEDAVDRLKVSDAMALINKVTSFFTPTE